MPWTLVWGLLSSFTVRCGSAARSCPTLLLPPWALACQTSLSMGFPKQEYWSGLPFPPPGKAWSRRVICTPTFTITKIQVSLNGLMNKQNVVYTYDGILVILKKGRKFWHILQIDEPENIMLSEINQTQKKKRKTQYDFTYLRCLE